MPTTSTPPTPETRTETAPPATAKGLREQLIGAGKRIRELADRANAKPAEWTDADEAEWTRVCGEYDSVKARAERLERADAVQKELRAPIGDRQVGREDYDGRAERDRRNGGIASDGAQEVTEQHRALAVQAWFREQAGLHLEERHEEACRLTRKNPRAKFLDIRLSGTESFSAQQHIARNTHLSNLRAALEQRALSAVTSTAGGVTVPQTTVNNLEIALLEFGGVLQVAEQIQTESGEPMTWPTVNDTTNKGRQLGEGGAVAPLDPTFGAVVWQAYKFTSDEILVPTELLEDNIFGPDRLAQFIGALEGERLGRILNEKFTTGTGAATPRGIVTASFLGKTAASGTAITADELLDLIHSVDPAYRSGARLMWHDNIFLAVRKLKDSSGQYLWQPSTFMGLKEGAPDRFQGYPFTINQDMASSIASGNKTVLFGLLSKYKARLVRTVRMYRLVERFRENDQDAFIAFVRADGNLLDAGTHPVKHLLQP